MSAPAPNPKLNSLCKYCHHAVPAQREPRSLKWNRLDWRCGAGKVVVQMKINCPGFEREPGSDDDLSGGVL